MPIAPIRGLLPAGPVRYGQIPFAPWTENPQTAVGRPYGDFKSNPWRVMAGHSPQDISGALDGNDLQDGVEKGIEYNFHSKICENGSHELLVTGDYVFACRSKGQESGSITLQDVGCFNILLKAGYEEDLIRFKELQAISVKEGKEVYALSEAEIYGERYYEKWKNGHKRSFLTRGSMGGSYYPDDDEADAIAEGPRRPQNNDDEDDEDGGVVGRPKICAEKSNDLQADNAALLRTLKQGSVSANEVKRSRYVGNEKVEMEQMRILNAFLLKSIESEQKMLKTESEARFRSLTFWKNRMGKCNNGLNYLYVGSIADFWNALGVVRSSSNDNGYANRLTSNAPSTRNRGPQVVVTTCKKSFQTTNIWKNELQLWDKVYYVLKRVDVPRGSKNWGPFQVVPFSNGREKPTPEDLEYVDFSGRKATGLILYVGYLSESTRGAIFPQQTRTMAAGIPTFCTPKETYDAKVVLDKLVLHVGLGDYAVTGL